MADSIETIAAAPVEVTLTDGKRYRLAKLTLNDWAAFCEWLKGNRLEEIKRADLPPEERRILYQQLITKPLESDEMFASVNSLPSMRWLLHRALSKHHADVGIEAVGDLFGSLIEMTEIVERIADVGEDEETADPPKQKPSRRRSS